MYEIIASDITNKDRIKYLENEGKLVLPPQRIRPPISLKVGSEWEKENLSPVRLIKSGWIFPSFQLPNAKALICKLRKKPKIVITEKFTLDSGIQNFAYTYLLVNGSWRSDEEMKAGNINWISAVFYHGLYIKISQEETMFHQLLINYMLNSPRYSSLDILRNITMMKENMVPFLDLIYPNCSVEQKKIIDDVKHTLELKSQLENSDETIPSIDQAPNPSVINKYINFQFTETDIQRATEKLDSATKLFNADQKKIFSNIVS